LPNALVSVRLLGFRFGSRFGHRQRAREGADREVTAVRREFGVVDEIPRIAARRHESRRALDACLREARGATVPPRIDASHEPRAADDDAVDALGLFTVALDFPELVVQPVSQLERAAQMHAAPAQEERAIDLDPCARPVAVGLRPRVAGERPFRALGQKFVMNHGTLTSFGSTSEIARAGSG
jgi:hypothetical protein